jgi:competence protein ComGC
VLLCASLLALAVIGRGVFLAIIVVGRIRIKCDEINNRACRVCDAVVQKVTKKAVRAYQFDKESKAWLGRLVSALNFSRSCDFFRAFL